MQLMVRTDLDSHCSRVRFSQFLCDLQQLPYTVASYPVRWSYQFVVLLLSTVLESLHHLKSTHTYWSFVSINIAMFRLHKRKTLLGTEPKSHYHFCPVNRQFTAV